MISIKNITKTFDGIHALRDVSIDIKNNDIYGILGTNGSGKSTLLKIMCGIISQDSGSILYSGEEIFENENVKSEIFYISDDQFFFNNTTPEDMKNFYSSLYKNFDTERYYKLLKYFELDKKRRVSTFSKGMKKQVSSILGVCSNTKYLLCDETFDGVDSIVRKTLKSIFLNDMEERGLTTIIASHNIRELDEVCGGISIFNKGQVVLSSDLYDLKNTIHKVQVVFKDGFNEEKLSKLNIVKKDNRGSVKLFTIKGDRDEILTYINSLNPLFFEILPLTLEEIFIVETERSGYDVKSIIL